MSIIIKGMKTPSSCKECDLMTADIRSDMMICTCFNGGDVTKNLEDAFDFRPNWCPLEDCKKSKLIVDDFNTEIWGANSNCILCGCSWQINDHGVDNFCPNCGASLKEGGE